MQDQGQGEGDHLQKQEQQQEQQQHQRQPAQPSAIRTPPRSPLPSAMNTTTKIAAGSSPSSLLLPRPSAVGNANRGVSWDLQQQQLVGNRPRAESTSSYSSKHFTLNDVIRNTPELEAETYLLRAVEKITGQAHQRTNTETSRLFNTIAAEELTSADLAQNDNFTSTTSTSTSNPVPNQSRANTGTSVASAKEGATTRTNANANANHTKPAPGVARAKFKSLVKKIQEQEANKSVEHTLFGLSHALAEMSKTSSAHKKSRYDSSVLEDERENDSTFKATDKLVQTVDNAIHKSKEEEEEEEKEIDVDAFIMDVETGGTGPENSTDMDSEPTDTDDLSGSPTNNNNNNNNNNDNADGTKNKNRKKRRKRRHKGAQLLNTAQDGLRVDWELFNEFLGGKKATIKNYVRTAVLFVVIPSLLLSIILFEFVESPETDANGNVIPGQKATPSWWILYFGVRQVVTFTMALITQSLLIDYLCLGSRFSLHWFGPVVTLLVVGSKGWPFMSIFWGVYNLLLLSGSKRYVRHWGYWQEWYGLFNEDNPGGHVIDNGWNYTVLRLMIVIGVAVSIKRLIVSLLLGRRTFAHFGQELADVMTKMLLIGSVATLSREIETDRRAYLSKRNPSYIQSVGSNLSGGWNPDTINQFVEQETDAALALEADAARQAAAQTTAADAAKTFVRKQKAHVSPPPSPGSPIQQALAGRDDDAAGAEFTESEQVAISELLDAWEEPTKAEEQEQRKITIGAVMQFRQALTFMKKKYPFLPAFGPADTRERCIQSAQQVYDRLRMRTPYLQYLPFETLALIAKDDEGGIDQKKARELIKIFRPERDGSIAKLDFVKSIDAIYKQLRLLSANVSNSSQIDKAVESIVNVFFYVILGCYVLYELGEDPLTLFFSFSSVILGFAFIFGASASKFFDGVLFILVQRPYGVGDRIHLSNPMLDTSPEGSSCWIVEKITLSTTSLYWAATNERATISNGAISNLRVINAARSPNATVFVLLKFGIDTPYEKIAIFKAAVEQYLKDRPKEWLAFVGFRPTDVAVDLGYIGYKVIAQHRAGWQLIGQVLESKAQLTTYCLECAKMLEIRYTNPPLPVDLKISGSAASALHALGQGGTTTSGQLDNKKIAEALRATSSRSMKHQAFQEEDE